jgi:penicillin-binding protein 1A
VETVIEDASRDYAELYDVSESAARLILLASGYSIYTTQNVAVQTILDEYFKDAANFPYEINNGLDFSMVISNAENADLLAIVGSVGEKRGDLIVNNATVPHTPASTLKPLALYAPLIDSGEISWATVFDDVPLEFIDGVRPYPANSPGVYNGLITVKIMSLVREFTKPKLSMRRLSYAAASRKCVGIAVIVEYSAVKHERVVSR